MRVKIYLVLLFVLLVSILFRIHVINSLLINSFISEPLLLSELLGKGVTIPWRLIFLLDLCNLFLLFFIGKNILGSKFGLLSSLIYGISPWMAYGQLFGSSYIFLLFFLLIFFNGVAILGKRPGIGFSVITASSAILLYSTLFSWLILPVLIFGIHKAKLMKPLYLKSYIFIIFLIFPPILLLSFNNLVGLKNIYRSQVGILSDPGFKNSINNFQGESKKEGFIYLTKLSENKYIYLSKYTLLKSIKNIVPSTYFTSQEKLFNFSFSPPIYVGFLPPFLYGLILVLKSHELRKYLLLSLVFIIPSFFSKTLVALNRLILFYPVIIFLISFGLTKLYVHKNPTLRFILYLSLFLLVLQIFITFFDISLREHQRYILSI